MYYLQNYDIKGQSVHTVRWNLLVVYIVVVVVYVEAAAAGRCAL